MQPQIEKTLSPNDVGETGTHQAGILVPKQPEILGLFPALGSSTKNPRSPVVMVDPSGRTWRFEFIYYNNAFFGGTRNEYRLTGMTDFLRSHKLTAGDRLVFQKVSDFIKIDIYRARAVAEPSGKRSRLTLRGSWRVISVKR